MWKWYQGPASNIARDLPESRRTTYRGPLDPWKPSGQGGPQRCKYRSLGENNVLGYLPAKRRVRRDTRRARNTENVVPRKEQFHLLKRPVGENPDRSSPLSIHQSDRQTLLLGITERRNTVSSEHWDSILKVRGISEYEVSISSRGNGLGKVITLDGRL